MKIEVLIAILFLAISTVSSQSLGCPSGKWIFDLRNANGITEMTYQKDTLIDNMSFEKYNLQITRLDINNGTDTLKLMGDPIFLSNQNGLVLYRWTREMTDTIFNFNASIGDSWTVIDRLRDEKYYEYIVLDTFRTIINGQSLFSISYDARPVEQHSLS